MSLKNMDEFKFTAIQLQLTPASYHYRAQILQTITDLH